MYTFDVAKKRMEKRTENVTIKATPSLKAELEKIAASNERTLSQTALLLLERGLAAFLRDGKLRNGESTLSFDGPIEMVRMRQQDLTSPGPEPEDIKKLEHKKQKRG